MAEQTTDTGAGHPIADPSEREIELELRQLALVDRVLGLEAEVARLSVTSPVAGGARDEVERLAGELRAVYASRTWRVGSAMIRAARLGRRG